VTVSRPTLDDVFVKFTGRSMDKVEEKVRPWWAQWAGDNWEQVQAKGGWKGNRWMSEDGTPKDPEAFEAWVAENAEGAPGEGVAGGEEEAEVSEGSRDEKKDEKPAGAGWAGNEWVNADGTPKDPEAMAKWLKETAGKPSK
jgi:hypothetical protein